VSEDLAGKLLAAIGETERIAQEAGGVWSLLTIPAWSLPGDSGEVNLGDKVLVTPVPESAAHIARHDPASVLRRCAADRKIVKDCMVKSQPGDPDHPFWYPANSVAEKVLPDLAFGYGIEVGG
jgi:hypothetical protein